MTPPDERIFVAFDTETTGLSPREAKVVEIAGVRFTESGDEISRFSTLANPGDPMSPEVVRIHGIRDEMVRRAPAPEEACRQFAGWLHPEDVLIAHNAAFDVAFIATALTRGAHPCPRNRVVDTLQLSRALDLPVPNFRLSSLVEHFALPATGYHRALGDSLHVMALYQRLTEVMAEEDPPRTRQLMEKAQVRSFHEMSKTLNLAPRVAVLPEAIVRGEIVTMRYEPDSGLGPFHRVRPIELCDIGGAEYLRAQCMHDGAVKAFRLDRIIGVEEG
ncbi:MAG: WYL domain-containing protein [Planctomycetes bacterium]|nr:WYL domain-containing protein [Planctomycetota bacterium]